VTDNKKGAGLAGRASTGSHNRQSGYALTGLKSTKFESCSWIAFNETRLASSRRAPHDVQRRSGAAINVAFRSAKERVFSRRGCERIGAKYDSCRTLRGRNRWEHNRPRSVRRPFFHSLGAKSENARKKTRNHELVVRGHPSSFRLPQRNNRLAFANNHPLAHRRPAAAWQRNAVLNYTSGRRVYLVFRSRVIEPITLFSFRCQLSPQFAQSGIVLSAPRGYRTFGPL
jgi:hypothetical protein